MQAAGPCQCCARTAASRRGVPSAHGLTPALTGRACKLLGSACCCRWLLLCHVCFIASAHALHGTSCAGVGFTGCTVSLTRTCPDGGGLAGRSSAAACLQLTSPGPAWLYRWLCCWPRWQWVARCLAAGALRRAQSRGVCFWVFKGLNALNACWVN